ncbi:MAG: DUF1820 family protein [Candidatus Binatia bacterium]
MAAKKRIYRVVFLNQGKIYEVYAKNISQGELFGFVEIEGLLFGEKTTVVVDPSEEALQREFLGVERTYIPLHAVVRIDEVEKRGDSKIHSVPDVSEKVTPLPTTIYTPVKRDS